MLENGSTESSKAEDYNNINMWKTLAATAITRNLITAIKPEEAYYLVDRVN